MNESVHPAFYRVLTPMGALLFLTGTAGALLLAPPVSVSATVASTAPLPSYLAVLAHLVVLPAFAYALSFSSLGVFVLPCLLLWQGYSQSSLAVSLCADHSLPTLLCVLGLPNLVAVPCMFAITIPAFLFSLIRFRQVLGKTSSFRPSRTRQLGILLICLSALTLCAFCCAFVSPHLTALST